MTRKPNLTVTGNFLDSHPGIIFIFGDNLNSQGYGGAAKLRDHPQARGFVTKKAPNMLDSSFYRPKEYKWMFNHELIALERYMDTFPEYIYYISQLGGGLANKYNIWENVIKPGLEERLSDRENVVFLWEE